MISPSTARDLTVNAISQIKQEQLIQERVRAYNRAQKAAAIEAARPQKTIELNPRIDAAVDRFISEVIEPRIVLASEAGKSHATFDARSTRYRRVTLLPLAQIIDDEFGQEAEALIRESSLASHSVAWWCGNAPAHNWKSMEYHILYRAGARLQALGYTVVLPVIAMREGCKVDQIFRDLCVRW